jgi:uncharacterized protein (TIGR02246 family)
MNRYSGPLAAFSVLFALFAASCGTNTPAPPAAPPDTRAADESAIRALVADWSKAAASKDAAKTASFYADNGTLLAPSTPAASGRDAVQKTWEALMATPGYALTFATTKVEVARSGDFAYDIGNYELTTNDKKGKPQIAKCKYLVVWQKQPGGSWKVLVDSATTSLE